MELLASFIVTHGAEQVWHHYLWSHSSSCLYEGLAPMLQHRRVTDCCHPPPNTPSHGWQKVAGGDIRPLVSKFADRVIGFELRYVVWVLISYKNEFIFGMMSVWEGMSCNTGRVFVESSLYSPNFVFSNVINISRLLTCKTVSCFIATSNRVEICIDVSTSTVEKVFI